MIRRENINIEEAIKKIFPKVLVKDLQEHERICPSCHGLGVRIVDNRYRINGDTSEAGDGVIIFWVFWILLAGGCVFGFYYIDNRWLE